MTTSLWGATEDSEEPVFCVFLHRFVASQVASMTIWQSNRPGPLAGVGHRAGAWRGDAAGLLARAAL